MFLTVYSVWVGDCLLNRLCHAHEFFFDKNPFKRMLTMRITRIFVSKAKNETVYSTLNKIKPMVRMRIKNAHYTLHVHKNIKR